MQSSKMTEKVKITIRDADTNAMLHECTTTRMILIYDTIAEPNEMLPAIHKLGKEQHVISLLNVLMQKMGFDHALKAMIMDASPFPYFTKAHEGAPQ